MKYLKVVLVASLLMLATVSLAAAQVPYQTQFITSVTYQNISNESATVTFQFYPEGSGSAISVQRQLPANAGSSLYIGGLAELPQNFSGSAVVSSSQRIVATVVQIPQGATVTNRPLANGFSTTSSAVTIATVLKNKFNQTTKFSVQNADSGAIDISVTFYNADDPNASPIVLTANNLPVGSSKSYDAGSLNELPNPFNGSAIITAKKAGTDTAANIVASALELGTNPAVPNDAKAFEGVSAGAKTVYMPSALCNAFGGQETFYAITNTSTTEATNVTVTYSNNNTETVNLGAGRKASFRGCAANPAGFNGSARITSTATDIVVIGKVSGLGIASAFLGEPSGAAKLALPYVRWTTDANYGAGQNRQRAFIAIQNVGDATVNNVAVKYLNKNGDVVATHTIASIGASQKANSTASAATLASGRNPIELGEFGYPEGNPGGGFGGSVIVEGPSGSQLVAVVRVASSLGDAGIVAEDYNGMSAQ